MTTGEKIQTLRKATGLTQEGLASQITVSRQAVSRWELNEVLPDTENLMQLSKIFNVSTDYLLDNNVTNEAELPLIQETTKKLEKKSKIKLFSVSIYLFMVLILLIISKSIMVAFVALSFGFTICVSCMLISLLYKTLRKK